jgi:pimeloyl-ACP methyl ester carboxylesterase
VRSGITLQRLVYTTIDAHGEPTVASGLLALPTDVEPVGVVSFGHGTDSLKSYVPSAPTGEGLGVSALFASGGFALVATDYVGLGLSPGHHPYLHAATEASASLDLLRAVRLTARESKVKLPRSVYITGFSQGGQAALALDRTIEADPDSPWRVVAVAPIAGPYDLSGTEFPDMIDGPSSRTSRSMEATRLISLHLHTTHRSHLCSMASTSLAKSRRSYRLPGYCSAQSSSQG